MLSSLKWSGWPRRSYRSTWRTRGGQGDRRQREQRSHGRSMGQVLCTLSNGHLWWFIDKKWRCLNEGITEGVAKDWILINFLTSHGSAPLPSPPHHFSPLTFKSKQIHESLTQQRVIKTVLTLTSSKGQQSFATLWNISGELSRGLPDSTPPAG